jgi:predicted transcriptional regulator
MSHTEDPDEQLLRAMRLMVLSSLRGLKQKEQVELMDRAGYGQNEIARFLGSAPKAISVRLSEVRKARKRRT